MVDFIKIALMKQEEEKTKTVREMDELLEKEKEEGLSEVEKSVKNVLDRRLKRDLIKRVSKLENNWDEMPEEKKSKIKKDVKEWSPRKSY
ncbi:MAG: hypothetical protein BTN85_1058 [Candidatus Methanohalarchaeum thermophilum]|uniref:Uncharacterized protein n=1 Tax=Methanohalarchaeum thermophilum TaxID=1903181 RepID=A0A1Q6DW21_METT1|nr:MAG: hypothetical protein BTN85_1058 [Candidatus Methanohalarchaeum thermophilum]